MNKIKQLIKKGFETGTIQLILIAVVFLITYIPFLRLGMYTHSNSDDFWMSMSVHRTYVKTGSILKTLLKAFKDTFDIYKTWDGCVLSMFLTIMSPVAFNENYYKIVYPFISLSMMIGTGVFSYQLFFKTLKINLQKSITLWLIFLIFIFEFMPFYSEAYYWWPGAVNYTLFFSVMFLLQGLIIRYLNSGKKCTVTLVFACFLAFCVGLGNLMNALISPMIIIMELFCYYFIAKKRDKYGMIAIAILSLAGLLINVAAPGNIARATFSMNGGYLFDNSPVKAIVDSLIDATVLMKAYYKKTMLIYIITAVILIFDVMKSENKTFRYPVPLLFTIFSYGTYCALWTPIAYSGIGIVARIQNTMFIGQVTVIMANLIYWFGWFSCKYTKYEFKNIRYCIIVLFMLVFVVYRGKNGYLYNSEFARIQVKSGAAKDFHDAVMERFRQYYDPAVREVYVEEINNIPGLFFYQDSSFDDLQRYFDKDIIAYREND